MVQLRPEDAMFDAMLRGWRAQQKSRGLRDDTIDPREWLIRRFLDFTNEYPWRWTPAHLDEWSASLTSERHLAPSTVRSYQGIVRLFTELLIDARYGWVPACEEAFGTFSVAICHEWNTLPHLQDYEGDPEARPFTREELQLFLDYADDQVERAVRAKRKGVLAAYRDATLFKVIYGWGLRRTETSKLDVVDFGRNPQARQFGRYGTLSVRYGKAKKGQPPRRRQNEYGVLQPLASSQIDRSVAAATTPAALLILALAAVHAARVAQIGTLMLDDLDIGNRRPTIAGRARPLDDLTLKLLLDWLEHRRRRWPNTANLHLLGPDPLHLAEVFGLDEKTAMRYADSARALLEQAAEQTGEPGSDLLPFCLPCPHEIEDCPGTVPGH